MALLCGLAGRVSAQTTPGTVDVSFTAAGVATNRVQAFALTADGGVLVGGRVAGTNGLGLPQLGLAKLTSNGTVSATFAVPPVAQDVSALLVLPSGQILLAGQQTNGLNGVVRRLNADGTVDGAFAPSLTVGGVVSPRIYALAMQADGKILVGGSFSTAGILPRTNLFRLNADGSVDTAFRTNFVATGAIFDVAVQSDGAILIGGSFTNVNGTARRGIARLLSSGLVDTNFNPGTGVDGFVRTLKLQRDGRVVIGGFFQQFNGVARSSVARLMPSGALDLSFDPGIGARLNSDNVSGEWPSVEVVALQVDGKALVGGKFDFFNSVARPNLVRLTLSGDVDSAFDPGTGPNAPVLALATQPDGKLLAGGEFVSINGVGAQRVARLLNDGTSAIAPSVTSPPTDVAVGIFGNARFSVEAIGTPTLLYQWLKGGFAVSGQTNSSLVLSNLQYSDSGTFSVLVSNDGGSVTSAPAILNVTPFPIAPSISSQPQSIMVATDAVGQFSAGAGGLNPLSWQWKRNGTNNVVGATNSTYEFTAVSTNLAGLYSAAVTNSYGSVTSAPASLFVYVPPTDLTTPAGTNVTFRVQVFGPSAVTFQWRFFGTNLVGATTSTLLRTNPGPEHVGPYTVVMSNITCVATSAPAFLTVNTPPRITAQPQSLKVAEGAPASRSAAVNGSAPFTYQWRFYGTNLPGATGSTFSLASVGTNDAGFYSCVISNAFGTATTASATLTVAGSEQSVFQIGSVSVFAGEVFEVPVRLVALGQENTIGFSIGFNPALLTLQSVTNGTAIASGDQVVLNQTAAAQGRIGVLAARLPSSAFPAGTNELLRLKFKVVSTLAAETVSSINFTSSPAALELHSSAARPLAATYLSGTATLEGGYEGDVAPTAGDNAVTALDWLQMGQYVVGNATPKTTTEFGRADCAPQETRGDGYLTAADVAQVGRYAVGIDPLKPAGGPTVSLASVSGSGSGVARSGVALMSRPGKTSLRTMRPSQLSTNGGTTTVAVNLESQGDENTVAFTLTFDSTRLQYRGAGLSGSLSNGVMLLLNTNLTAQGKLGVLMGLGAGQTFAGGPRELLQAQFQMLPGAVNQSAVVGFSGGPVINEVVSVNAAALPTTFQSVSVPVPARSTSPLPTGQMREANGSLRLTWNAPESGAYALEASTNLTHWTSLTNYSLPASGVIEFKDTSPALWPQRYFRVR